MACVLVAIGIRVRQPDSDRKSIMRTEHCGVYPRVVTPTLYLLVSWYALLPLSVPAADKAAPKLSTATIKSIRRAIKSTMAQQQVVGVAVGVIRAGSVVYLEGLGYEDREKQIPVTSQTRFRWASISKTLTAVATLQLWEKKRLKLSDTVRHYVPEFPDKGVPISIRDLLCHQGGIVHYSNGRVIRTTRTYPIPQPFAEVMNALDLFKESPLVCRPGERPSYTTHGYILLSSVVQRSGTQPFAEQIRDRIVRPLELQTLQPDYQWESIPHRAVGYRQHQGKIVRSTNTDVSWKLGGGGYLSNIDDLARYTAALIEHQLIDPDTATRMWTPQRTQDGTVTGIGLGFMLQGSGQRLRVSHNGSQEKTRTRMVFYPAQRHGVVVMSNSEYANPAQFTTAVYQAWRQAERKGI